jgi:hypothetical protein
MQQDKYAELEDRATVPSLNDQIKQLEARVRVHQEIEAMKAEGKALVLTDEEMRLLAAFRRFKLEGGGYFEWRTPRNTEISGDVPPPPGQLLDAAGQRASGLIRNPEDPNDLHPQEIVDTVGTIAQRVLTEEFTRRGLL